MKPWWLHCTVTFGIYQQAVTQKITGIMNACNFISLMIDGSQAHKTGSDKELNLVRVVRHDGT